MTYEIMGIPMESKKLKRKPTNEEISQLNVIPEVFPNLPLRRFGSVNEIATDLDV